MLLKCNLEFGLAVEQKKRVSEGTSLYPVPLSCSILFLTKFAKLGLMMITLQFWMNTHHSQLFSGLISLHVLIIVNQFHFSQSPVSIKWIDDLFRKDCDA